MITLTILVYTVNIQIFKLKKNGGDFINNSPRRMQNFGRPC